MFSAISAKESSCSSVYCSQIDLLHNSIRFETPMTTHSFSSFAYWSRLDAMLMRPCLSRSHSTAPEKKNRVRLRGADHAPFCTNRMLVFTHEHDIRAPLSHPYSPLSTTSLHKTYFTLFLHKKKP